MLLAGAPTIAGGPLLAPSAVASRPPNATVTLSHREAPIFTATDPLSRSTFTIPLIFTDDSTDDGTDDALPAGRTAWARASGRCGP